MDRGKLMIFAPQNIDRIELVVVAHTLPIEVVLSGRETFCLFEGRIPGIKKMVSGTWYYLSGRKA